MSETGKWIGVVAFAAFCGGVYVLAKDDGSSEAPAPATPVKAARSLPIPAWDFGAETVKRTAGQAIEKTARLFVDEYGPTSIQLRLVYPKDLPAVSTEVAGEDARLIAKAAVETLMAAGWNPRTEWTMVHVHARQTAEPSITGGEMVRPLGRATYDFSTDRIEFTPP